jgi:DNA-binding CsgD family transcriptional regulator
VNSRRKGVAELTITPEFDNDTSGIKADERRILDLLYVGLNDATIARRLGMGHRTVQRKVQRLMERLQANGRVALGAHAQELGLLDSAGLVPDEKDGQNRTERASDRNTHARESTFAVRTPSASLRQLHVTASGSPDHMTH